LFTQLLLVSTKSKVCGVSEPRALVGKSTCCSKNNFWT